MASLSPTQMFLWIIMLIVVCIPIIAFLFTWITNIWFSKKTEHITEVIVIISKAINNAMEEHAKIRKDKENEDEQGTV